MKQAVLVAAALAAMAHAAWAADDPTPAPAPRAAAAPADPLATARGLIKQERWRDAIDALQRANQPQSADWNNLMGYSYRKAKTPDLAAAERYYDAALRIDPNHRGALEYSGELMLMKNDVPAAKSRLARLQAVCNGGCAELDDLKAAIARHEGGAR